MARSLYSPDIHIPLAVRLAEAGALDAEVARQFGIGIRTLYEWKVRHPQLSQALTRAKAVADERVENALFQRATGYTFEREKLMTISRGEGRGSEVVRVLVEEHVLPDVTACIFWLKNRRPQEWRDMKATEISGPVGNAVKIEASKEQREAVSRAVDLIHQFEIDQAVGEALKAHGITG